MYERVSENGRVGPTVISANPRRESAVRKICEHAPALAMSGRVKRVFDTHAAASGKSLGQNGPGYTFV